MPAQQDTSRWVKKGVFFDLDGVLIQTEPQKATAHSETVKHFGGKEIPTSFYYQIVGVALEPVVRYYLKEGGIPHVDIDEYIRVFRKQYFASLETNIIITPGIECLLTQLLEKGYRLAIVSAGASISVNKVLSKTNLSHFFSFVITANDVGHTKPDPEPYLLALEKMNINPTSAVTFEDSETSIRSAANAGIGVIALLNGYNINHDFNQAQVVLHNIDNTSSILTYIAQLTGNT